MFNVLSDINWLALVAGFAAFAVLGGLWFAVLFTKPYNRSLGRAEDAPPVRSPLFAAGPPLCSLAITVTTVVLIEALGISSPGDAAVLALIAGIGYLAATTTMIAINPNFPHPLRYALISGGYNVAGVLAAAVIYTALA
ncbi:DUF1761 domain-containing protein [Actinoplanes sp. RD1]|uniref:DUF1761 domain-containing protein n=1 Tax=Actinoplanes sp. RD1 TaxID=3064538 RepID=UPI002741FA3F|nr:DUF1761 domain-containing protein [Actinoplanes sp. RD1]